MNASKAACLGVLAGLLACTPSDFTGAQVVQVFGLKADGTYDFVHRRIETLESVRRVKGDTAVLRGGGTLLVESTFLLPESDPRAIAQITGDTQVSTRVHETDAGLVPADWDSLMMLSFYSHLERARVLFEALAVPQNALRPITVHYNLRFAVLVLGGRPLITDNAGYVAVADAFWLFPGFELVSGVPLIANEGVVMHEYSHAIKHRLLHEPNEMPPILTDTWQVTAVNAYRADDEGLADFFGALFSNDPRFIEASYGTLARERDLLLEHPFSLSLHARLGDPLEVYDPYPLGSALASWLWHIGQNDTERWEVAVAIVRTLQTHQHIFAPTYAMTDLLGALVEELPDHLQGRACELLDQRLRGPFRAVPQCSI